MNDPITPLLHRLRNGDPNEQNRAADELAKCGSQAVEPLIHVLQHDKDEIRWRAAHIFRESLRSPRR